MFFFLIFYVAIVPNSSFFSPFALLFWQHFGRYDSDGSGFIDRDELGMVLRALYKPTRQEVKNFVAAFNKNVDGEITFDV